MKALAQFILAIIVITLSLIFATEVSDVYRDPDLILICSAFMVFGWLVGFGHAIIEIIFED